MFARRAIPALLTAMVLAACSMPTQRPTAAAAAATNPAATLDRLADRYVAAVLKVDPSVSYFSGLPLATHDYLPQNSRAAMTAWEGVEDDLYSQLLQIDPARLTGTPGWTVHAVLKESLESSRGLRVCHQERWNVSLTRTNFQSLVTDWRAEPFLDTALSCIPANPRTRAGLWFLQG